MAMASTTSAAASMLLSGSLPSMDGLMNTSLLSKTLFPNCPPSLATLSASAPFPTVTLDLVSTPVFNQSQIPQGQFIVTSPTLPHNLASMPHISGQGLYNQSKSSGLIGSQGMEIQIPSLGDPVSATTAAITANPNFTAALAAAITSIIGNVHANNNGNHGPTIRNSNDNNIM